MNNRKEFSGTTKRLTEERQRGFCAICHIYLSSDDVKKVEYHHILGNQNNHLDNCVALCFSCHRQEAHYEGKTDGYVLSREDLDIYGKDGDMKSYEETIKFYTDMNGLENLNESLDDLYEKKQPSTQQSGSPVNKTTSKTSEDLLKILGMNTGSSSSSGGNTISQINKNITGRHHHVDLDAVLRFHKTEGEFRDNLASHLAKLITLYHEFYEMDIWYDIRHEQYGRDHLLPIMSDFEILLNNDYQKVEGILLDYISKVGILDGTERTAYTHEKKNLSLNLLTVTHKIFSGGLPSSQLLENFHYELKGVVKKAIETVNALIQELNRMEIDQEWSDEQYENHCEYIEKMKKKLEEILEKIDSSEKTLRLWMSYYDDVRKATKVK